MTVPLMLRTILFLLTSVLIFSSVLFLSRAANYNFEFFEIFLTMIGLIAIPFACEFYVRSFNNEK